MHAVFDGERDLCRKCGALNCNVASLLAMTVSGVPAPGRLIAAPTERIRDKGRITGGTYEGQQQKRALQMEGTS